MDDKDRKVFEHISETLDKILHNMETPKSKFELFLEYGGAGVSILGLLGIIDIIKTWIFGG